MEHSFCFMAFGLDFWVVGGVGSMTDRCYPAKKWEKQFRSVFILEEYEGFAGVGSGLIDDEFSALAAVLGVGVEVDGEDGDIVFGGAVAAEEVALVKEADGSVHCLVLFG